MGRESCSDEGGLFSLDLSQHGGQHFPAKGKDSQSDSCAGIAFAKLASFCRPDTMFEYKLLEVVRRFKLVSTDSSGVDHAMLAKLLAAAGYTVSLQSPEHQCSCKSKTRRCLENLSHTYLTCSGAAGVVLEAEIIIEPRLMEQFEIAHPTEAYTGLLASLPSEFVGTASKLRTIVEAVSAAMADAFKAQDLSLPPWRRTSAALSKWGLDQAPANGQSPSHSPELHQSWAEKTREGTSCAANEPGPRSIGFPDNGSTGGSPGLPVEDPFRKVATQQVEQVSQRAKGPPQRGKQVVSLLARGLEDMEMLQKAKRPLEGGAKAPKIKRAPSRELNGLAHITTVRRSGKVTS